MRGQTLQAIILAGGRGERLRPLTDDRPKPMVLVGDVPLLCYSIRWLKNAGIERIVISCGYRHSSISDYFGDGSKFGVSIDYSVEQQPLGRGGGIKLASKKLWATKSPVIVLNGDTVTDLNLDDLYEEHAQGGKPITITATPLHCSYGTIDLSDDGLAVAFREKPILPYWVNAGIYAVEPATFAEFPDQGDHEELLFPQLAKELQLNAHKFKGFWKAIDTRKDLEDLKREKHRLGPTIEQQELSELFNRRRSGSS